MSTELEKRKEEEYEMQLFGFHSRAVHATFELIVEERIQQCCKKLVESLERIYKPDESNARILITDGRNLTKTYHTRSQPRVITMKKCIQKFISVPRNILLEEDKSQEVQYTEKEFKDMEKHLQHLQMRAKKAKMVHTALTEEVQLIEQFERNESVAKMLSIVMEDSNMLRPDVDSKMIKCVENYKVLENTVKKSGAVSETYKNSVHDRVMRVKSLDLDNLPSNLSVL